MKCCCNNNIDRHIIDYEDTYHSYNDGDDNIATINKIPFSAIDSNIYIYNH